MAAPNNAIFLTGFPGFIAERLVARLARSSSRLYLLVQPAFAEQARRAVERIAKAEMVSANNFVVVEGDIRKADLDISPAMLAAIRADVTDVFHLAAVYDLAVQKDLAFAVNLEGTKNVNALVRTLANLRRYNYVSTCYVAGKREGRIFENELEHGAGFRNYYEETKYLAEVEVENLKKELPVTIHRPSVVVGDSHTGETAKYDGIYSLIQYLRMAPRLLRLVNVGNRSVRLNLVPVDFVVEAMVEIAASENAIGKTVALADPAPLTTAELFDRVAEILSGGKSILKPPPWLVRRSLMLPFSPPLTGLPHAAVPYFFLSQTYDTAVADTLLAPGYIRCPSFADYAPALIDFVNRNPNL